MKKVIEHYYAAQACLSRRWRGGLSSSLGGGRAGPGRLLGVVIHVESPSCIDSTPPDIASDGLMSYQLWTWTVLVATLLVDVLGDDSVL